jgi:hypothetical protein
MQAGGFRRCHRRAETLLILSIPDGLSPHSLRRAFASLLYLRGENPSTSCTKWATSTPSSPSASTPRSWANNNAAADPAHDSSASSTEHGGRRPNPRRDPRE